MSRVNTLIHSFCRSFHRLMVMKKSRQILILLVLLVISICMFWISNIFIRQKWRSEWYNRHHIPFDFIHSQDKADETSSFYCNPSTKQPFNLLPSVYDDDGYTMKNLPQVRNIPRIFHFMWKDRRLPVQSVDNLLTWRRLHPDWKFVFWTDKDLDNWMHRFLGDGRLLRKFRNYRHQIMRADFARYVILYIIGGVYADIDVKPLRSLEPLLNHHSAIIARELEPFPVSLVIDTTILASNFLMASRPGHPFWPLLLHRIYEPRKGEIINHTGPMVLSEAIRQYKSDHPLVHSDASIFLAPSMYFDPPVRPEGDHLHIKMLKYICPWVRRAKHRTKYMIHTCDFVNRWNRIDFNVSYEYPRYYQDSFVIHQMFDTYGPNFMKKLRHTPIANLLLGLTDAKELTTFHDDIRDPFELDKIISKMAKFDLKG